MMLGNVNVKNVLTVEALSMAGCYGRFGEACCISSFSVDYYCYFYY
jgi:hypothetical protein